jgi:hypothetical protein
MIGSLMSRMADAEKLSIPQLNEAVKNGTIPAYVGVPLIQEKMKAEQAAKAMVAQTQAQPPLARQVMEQADMMSGLEKLQSNLPEEGYAGGGIVAFAEGGEAQPTQPAMSIAPPKGYTFDQTSGQYDPINQGGDILSILRGESGPIARLKEIMQSGRGYAEGGVTTPDEDEDEEKNLMSRLMAGITSLKQGVSDRIPSSEAIKQSIVNKMPSSMRSAMYEGPQRGDYVAPPAERRARGGHKYENMVAAEAERIGLDPNIAVHALYKETGNLKNPESARSRAGALGVMQLMPRTAKELGVDPLNPEDNIRGGVMYLKKMYDKYQDPTLTLAAYNAGPGRVDKALKSGRGIEGLPRETQNYVMARNMAGGGIVAFQNRGLVEPKGLDDLTPEEIEQMSKPYIGAAKPFTKERTEELQKRALGAAHQRQMEEEDRARFTPETVVPPTTPTAPPTTAPAAPEPAPYKEPAADQGISDIKNLLKQRMEESGKQKRIDAYMSLLQAGLGMMGGSSPFAAVNIGQGASTGVAAQMAARKSQVADENAILTGQLGLSRAELYEKMRRDALKQQYEKDLAAQKLGRERLGVQQQAQNIRLGDLRRKASEDWDNSPRKAQLEADLAKQKKNWRQDPKLLGQFEMMRNRFINEFVNVGQADNILSSSQL